MKHLLSILAFVLFIALDTSAQQNSRIVMASMSSFIRALGLGDSINGRTFAVRFLTVEGSMTDLYLTLDSTNKPTAAKLDVTQAKAKDLWKFSRTSKHTFHITNVLTNKKLEYTTLSASYGEWYINDGSVALLQDEPFYYINDGKNGRVIGVSAKVHVPGSYQPFELCVTEERRQGTRPGQQLRPTAGSVSVFERFIKSEWSYYPPRIALYPK